MNADPTVVPVAIYTRKSTNHNMDLEMNSSSRSASTARAS